MRLAASLFITTLVIYMGWIKSIPHLSKKSFRAKHFINLQHYRPDYMIHKWPHDPSDHNMEHWPSRPSQCICYPSQKNLDKCYKKAMRNSDYVYERTMDSVLKWCKQDIHYTNSERSIALDHIMSDYNRPLRKWQVR